jgi:hypothetical protein
MAERDEFDIIGDLEGAWAARQLMDFRDCLDFLSQDCESPIERVLLRVFWASSRRYFFNRD